MGLFLSSGYLFHLGVSSRDIFFGADSLPVGVARFGLFGIVSYFGV